MNKKLIKFARIQFGPLFQGKLSKAETVEKNTLPTKEVIEAEKKA